MTGSWKLTPSKPSLLMLTDGGEAIVQEYCDHREWDSAKDVVEGLDHERVWDAMLSAAPTPPDEVLERMARAFLDEYSATGNEIASIRDALSAAGEK